MLKIRFLMFILVLLCGQAGEALGVRGMRPSSVTDNLQATDILPLPGRETTVAEAAAECEGAVVASLAGLGFKSPGPPGATDYDQTEWRILNSLRGAYPTKTCLDLRVQIFPERSRERVPKVGDTYILLSYGNIACQIRKMVEYTPENLTELKRLLAKRKQIGKGVNHPGNQCSRCRE